MQNPFPSKSAEEFVYFFLKKTVREVTYIFYSHFMRAPTMQYQQK